MVKQVSCNMDGWTDGNRFSMCSNQALQKKEFFVLSRLTPGRDCFDCTLLKHSETKFLFSTSQPWQRWLLKSITSEVWVSVFLSKSFDNL